MVGDKLIDKTKHKVLLPEFKSYKNFQLNIIKGIIIAFLILLIPAYYGNKIMMYITNLMNLYLKI